MTVKIITDSGANSFDKLIAGVPHVNVPLTLTVNGHSFQDDSQLDLANFLQALKDTQAPTSSACPSIGSWLAAFQGADEIFVLTITSALSGSYSSAIQASKIYLQDHPNVRIHIFDSKSAGPQIRLIASILAILVNNHYPFDEIVELVNEQIKKTDLLFCLQELDNLANSGRISPTIAKLAKMLNLCVLGTANDQGEFEMLGRQRSTKKLYHKLVKVMIKQGYHGGRVFIDHVQCHEKATKMAAAISAAFPSAIITIANCGALCSYYAENGGLMIGFEK